MKKSILTSLASMCLMGTAGKVSEKIGPQINENTGVITLSSMFTSISKKVHRNGRRNNVDGRFGSIKLKYK